MALNHRSLTGYTPSRPAPSLPSPSTTAAIYPTINPPKSFDKPVHNAVNQRPEVTPDNGALRLDSTLNCRPQTRQQPQLYPDMPALGSDSDSSDSENECPAAYTRDSSQQDSSLPTHSQFDKCAESLSNEAPFAPADNSDRPSQPLRKNNGTTRSGRNSRAPVNFADSQHEAAQQTRQQTPRHRRQPAPFPLSYPKAPRADPLL